MSKARVRDYAILTLVVPVFIAWWGGGAVRAAYGIGRALVKGQTGSRKIYSESQR